MSTMSFQSTSLTDTGRVRKANEDSMFSMPEAGLFGVADGMGGAAGGEYASKTTLECVARAAALFTSATTQEERVAALRNAVDQASREIHAWAEHRGIAGTGTTVVLLALDARRSDRAMLLHAGDSRAYLMRGGRLRQLTRDHSVAESFANGRDESVPAVFRNVVTNAIGLTNNVRLEDTPVELRRGDLIMLCSDGLYRMVKDEEIGATLASSATLEERAASLMKSALDHGGKDNVTLILVHFSDAESPGAKADEPETHDTEVRSAREASQQHPHPTHSSTHDSTIVGRSFTDDQDTHERPPAPAGMPSALATSSVPDRRKWWLAGIAAGLVLAGLWLLLRNSDQTIPAEGSAVESVAPAAPPADGDAPPVAERASSPPLEKIETLIQRARETGDWSFAPERLAELNPDHDATAADTARAWMDEWRRARNQPDQVRAELMLFRNDIEKTIRSWDEQFAAPSIDPWSDNPVEAARLYCFYRARLQARFFHELDRYIGDSMQVLSAFGGTPERIETRLRAASISRDDDPPSLGPKLEQLQNMLQGLNRWKERSRHLPVGLADSRNVIATFLTPMEQGVRGLFVEVADYVREIPTLPRLVEARPAVQSFYDQKNQFLAAMDEHAHTHSETREKITPLLRDLLYAPGLQDIAAGSIPAGGAAP